MSSYMQEVKELQLKVLDEVRSELTSKGYIDIKQFSINFSFRTGLSKLRIKRIINDAVTINMFPAPFGDIIKIKKDVLVEKKSHNTSKKHKQGTIEEISKGELQMLATFGDKQ